VLVIGRALKYCHWSLVELKGRSFGESLEKREPGKMRSWEAGEKEGSWEKEGRLEDR
jgi:hypothetical protein